MREPVQLLASVAVTVSGEYTGSTNARYTLVPTSDGGSVPLKSVAEITFGSGPVTVQRTNQVYRIAVGADLVPGAISGDAYKLGDVLRARSGKTIEVLNTDAEGRLVLADEPTSAPVIIIAVLCRVKPIAAAAQPE